MTLCDTRRIELVTLGDGPRTPNTTGSSSPGNLAMRSGPAWRLMCTLEVWMAPGMSAPLSCGASKIRRTDLVTRGGQQYIICRCEIDNGNLGLTGRRQFQAIILTATEAENGKHS